MTWIKSNGAFLFGLLLISLLLSLWSYVFVDPNLLLINQPWWVELQNWFWQARGEWSLLSLQYVFLLFAWWVLYIWGSRVVGKISRPFLLFLALIIAVLWVGHNALSHDIFNYLFNAKLLVEYGVDPHSRTALEFASDPWVRFMHNIHTSAPYGYGWTSMSVIPYFLGFGSFFLAYIAMKAWMILGLTLYLWLGWYLLQNSSLSDKAQRFWLFAVNPLLLWETVLNGHNDVWMMWPALASLALLTNNKRSWWQILLAAGFLAFSISIKLATAVLIPIALFLLLWPVVQKRIKKISSLLGRLGEHLFLHWADYSAVALLIPLTTDRSQQFLPWYLIWSWSFFPLLRWNWLRWLLLALSLTSLLRYLPWLQSGLEYSDEIQLQMRIITWSALAIIPVALVFTRRVGWLPKSK